jgi:hypothetical protein
MMLKWQPTRDFPAAKPWVKALGAAHPKQAHPHEE